MKWIKLKERGLLSSEVGSTVFVWILSLWDAPMNHASLYSCTRIDHTLEFEWSCDLLYSIRWGRSDTLPVQSQALKKPKQLLLLCTWPWVTVLERSCGGTVEIMSENTWRRIKEPSQQKEPCSRCKILVKLSPASSQVFEPSQLRC